MKLFKNGSSLMLVLLLLLSGCGAEEPAAAVSNPAVTAVPTVASQPDPVDNARQWGSVLREDSVWEDDAIAIRGLHFTVTRGELDRLVAAQSLIDPDTALEVTREQLVEKYSLYYQAQEAGTVLTDAEVRAYLAEQTEIFADMSTDENYGAFLDGIGMTNEEYWETQWDEVQIRESIAAWERQLRAEFEQENGYDVSPPADSEAQWEAYYSGKKAEIIAAEQVEYLSEPD